MNMMKIRKYANYAMVFCLLAWGTQFLTGCAESDHIDEYTFNKVNKPNEPESPTSDEVIEALEKIPGVSDVSVKYSEKDSNEYGYYFNVQQLIDHKNPKSGTFKQRCFLKYGGWERPVVLDTEGYRLSPTLEDVDDEQDLVKHLKANYLSVEYRYFGTSLPEPFENTNFTYLYSDQAAADLHDIVTLIQKHLFPRNNKWVATGVSKSGINAALYAYYSDKNGWNDIDLFMPFCAPFIKASKESCLDIGLGYYLINCCGNGYPEGSQEAVAYKRLCALPAAISGNKQLRDACLRRFHQELPDTYKSLLDYYEGEKLEKAAIASVINNFYTNLQLFFSYKQYSTWAKFVPDVSKATKPDADISDIFQVVEFVFMKQEQLEKMIDADNMTGGSGRRSPLDDNDIIVFRKSDNSMPYYLQSYRELGSLINDFSLVDGTFLTKKFAEEVAYLSTVESQFSKRFPNQWDGGKLMTDVHKWAATTTTQPIIFTYSYNDPWTGNAIEDAVHNPSRKVWKVLNLVGTHSNEFLNPDKCDAKASQTIKDAIKTVLGEF